MERSVYKNRAKQHDRTKYSLKTCYNAIEPKFNQILSLRSLVKEEILNFNNLEVIFDLVCETLRSSKVFNREGYFKSDTDYILTFISLSKAFGLHLEYTDIDGNDKYFKYQLRKDWFANSYKKKMLEAMNKPFFFRSVLGRCYKSPSLFEFTLSEVTKLVNFQLEDRIIVGQTGNFRRVEYPNIIPDKSDPNQGQNISNRKKKSQSYLWNLFKGSGIIKYDIRTVKLIKIIYQFMIEEYKFKSYNGVTWDMRKKDSISKFFNWIFRCSNETLRDKLLKTFFNCVKNDKYRNFTYNALLEDERVSVIEIRTLLSYIPFEFLFGKYISKISIKKLCIVSELIDKIFLDALFCYCISENYSVKIKCKISDLIIEIKEEFEKRNVSENT